MNGISDKIRIGVIVIAIVGITMLLYIRIDIHQCQYLKIEELGNPENPCFRPDAFCEIKCWEHNDTYIGYDDICHCGNGSYLFIEDVGFVYVQNYIEEYNSSDPLWTTNMSFVSQRSQ